MKKRMIKVGNKQIPPFFKNQIIKKVKAIDISSQGFAVVKKDNFVIFTKALLINEIADIKIIKVYKNHAIAKVEKLHKKSEFRQNPLCPYFQECNGCKYQHIDYKRQIEIKEKQLENLFGYKVKVASAENEYYYRNKSSFTISSNEFNMYDILNNKVKIKQCPIANKEINNLMPTVLSTINDYSNHQIKSVTFRYSKYKDSIMLIFTSEKESEIINTIAQKIIEANNKVVSIVLSIGKSSNYLFNEKEKIIVGKDIIQDKIFNKIFNITSKAFYQINNQQTEKLYNKILEFKQFKKSDNVLDLYCGVGSIGIIISDYVNSVLGLEINKDAVASAQKNIRLNKASNVKVIKHDLRREVKIDNKINTIIVDPPRSGLSNKTIKAIIESKTESLIYVSCNPKTQKRDIDTLKKNNYKVIKHEAVDMFINTEHVEGIALMQYQG